METTAYQINYASFVITVKDEEVHALLNRLVEQAGDLCRQIVARANADAVTIEASPVYAAIQQFGGKAGRGHKVTIPARPFLPVRQDGTLYPQEQAEIIAAIKDMLAPE